MKTNLTLLLFFSATLLILSCRKEDDQIITPEPTPDYNKLIVAHAWQRVRVVADPPQDFGDGPKSDVTEYAIDSCNADNKIEFYNDSTYMYYRKNYNCIPPTYTYWSTWRIDYARARLYVNGSTTSYYQISSLSDTAFVMYNWANSSIDSMTHRHTSYYIPYK